MPAKVNSVARVIRLSTMTIAPSFIVTLPVIPTVPVILWVLGKLAMLTYCPLISVDTVPVTPTAPVIPTNPVMLMGSTTLTLIADPSYNLSSITLCLLLLKLYWMSYPIELLW